MRVAYGGDVLRVPSGWRLAAVADDGGSVTLEREGAPAPLALPAPAGAGARPKPKAGAAKGAPPATRSALEAKILRMLREAGRPITSQPMCVRFLGPKAPPGKVRYLKLLLGEMGARGQLRVLPRGEGQPRTRYQAAA